MSNNEVAQTLAQLAEVQVSTLQYSTVGMRDEVWEEYQLGKGMYFVAWNVGPWMRWFGRQ